LAAIPEIEIEKLRDLNSSKQIAFAYLTCERLYPNYVYFSINYNFGDPFILRESIDFIYYSIFESNPNKVKINSLEKGVDKNTPEPGEFDTGLASSALDACTAILESLAFLIDNKFSRIINISTFATDTVFMYVQDIEKLDFNKDKDFKKRIYTHPLMENEIKIQSGIITFLNNSTSLDFGDLQTLKQLQGGNKGSLDL
jgi:uncharacterized protein YjaG (DUF416 family)